MFDTYTFYIICENVTPYYKKLIHDILKIIYYVIIFNSLKTIKIKILFFVLYD